MADAPSSVRITGLKETAAAFRKVDKNLPKELRLHFLDIADHVAGEAQQKMPFRSGDAARSLQARATQKSAGIAVPRGGQWTAHKNADYYPWLEYGGHVGPGRLIARAARPGGRYLYPAIAESQDYIREETIAAVEVVARHANFGTE